MWSDVCLSASWNDARGYALRKARQSGGVFQGRYSAKLQRQSKRGRKKKRAASSSSTAVTPMAASDSCDTQSQSPSQSRSTSPRGRRGRLSPEDEEDGIQQVLSESSRQWSGRRRDPKVNGADLYVARITKHGVGNAKPCWRCIEWCRWAGVKRIFHFVGEAGQFNVVKVNEARGDATYETHADVRLFAGAVSGVFSFIVFPLTAMSFSHGEVLYSLYCCLYCGPCVKHYFVPSPQFKRSDFGL